MIEEISIKFSESLSKNGVIPKEEREIYRYGMEALIATVVNFIIVLSLGLACHKLLHTIFFLLVYCSIRSFAGGYHAKNHLSCIVTFASTYLVLLILSGIFPIQQCNVFLVIGWILSFIIIWLIAPVEDLNRPIEEEENKNFSKKSKTLIVVNTSVLIAGFYLFPNFSEYIVFGVFGFVSIGLVALIGFIKNGFHSIHDVSKEEN